MILFLLRLINYKQNKMNEYLKEIATLCGIDKDLKTTILVRFIFF